MFVEEGRIQVSWCIQFSWVEERPFRAAEASAKYGALAPGQAQQSAVPGLKPKIS